MRSASGPTTYTLHAHHPQPPDIPLDLRRRHGPAHTPNLYAHVQTYFLDLRIQELREGIEWTRSQDGTSRRGLSTAVPNSIATRAGHRVWRTTEAAVE